MPTYIVTFEISKQENVTAVENELKTFPSYCPIHENAWAVSGNTSAKALRDKLSTLIGASDRLFVIKSGLEAAWWNSYGEKHNEWLKANL